MLRWLTGITVAACVAGAGSAPVLADPNCRCRLYGEYFDIGSVMCIRGSLRRCEMNQNNTSWKKIGDICPQAGLDRGTLPDQPRRAYAGRLDSSIPSPE
jgi:hypothetical protein